MLRTTAAQNAIFVLLDIFLSPDEVCGLAPIERHLLTEVLAHLVWGQLADALIADAIGFAGSPKGVQKRRPGQRPGPPQRGLFRSGYLVVFIFEPLWLLADM
jgi:hypothetical protein